MVRVLVAEDDRRTAEVMGDLLHAHGHEIVGLAASGEEAIQLARSLRPDVVLMDVIMPGIGGIEATRQINQENLAAVVMLTAYEDDELVARANQAGAMAYLVKPVQARAMARTVITAAARFEELRAARERERRDRTLSVVAHKLSNPATVVIGFAAALDRLMRGRRLSSFEQRAIAGILTNARRLTQMIADLLAAAQIEDRRLSIARTPTNLLQLVRTVVEKAAGDPARVELRGPVPLVLVDAQRIDQVLVDVLATAAAYADLATPLLVEVETRGTGERSEVVVSVGWQGRAIGPADLAELFRPFSQLSTSPEQPVPGLGLGLYVARELVEAHGGQLWIESGTATAATTACRFTLPLLPVEPG